MIEKYTASDPVHRFSQRGYLLGMMDRMDRIISIENVKQHMGTPLMCAIKGVYDTCFTCRFTPACILSILSKALQPSVSISERGGQDRRKTSCPDRMLSCPG